MSHAIDVINPAIEKTKRLLFPFRFKFWLKLTLLVLLISFSMPGSSDRVVELGKGDFPLSTNLMILAIGFITLLALFGLLLAYVSSVCTFVFLESVLKKRVKLVEGFKRYIKGGLQLLVFKIALGIVTFVAIVLTIVPGAIIYGTGRMSSLWLSIPYIVVAVLLIFAIIILVSIINSFTVDFVVPLMYGTREGILKGWRSLLKVVKKERGQFLTYILVKILLGLVGGLISLVVTLVLLVVFLILFGIPLFLLSILFGLVGLGIQSLGMLSMPLIALLVVLGIVVVLLFLCVVTFFTLPITVFFRFYSLLFLEKVHPEVSWFGEAKKEPEKPKEEIKPSEYSVY